LPLDPSPDSPAATAAAYPLFAGSCVRCPCPPSATAFFLESTGTNVTPQSPRASLCFRTKTPFFFVSLFTISLPHSGQVAMLSPHFFVVGCYPVFPKSTRTLAPNFLFARSFLKRDVLVCDLGPVGELCRTIFRRRHADTKITHVVVAALHFF